MKVKKKSRERFSERKKKGEKKKDMVVFSISLHQRVDFFTLGVDGRLKFSRLTHCFIPKFLTGESVKIDYFFFRHDSIKQKKEHTSQIAAP